MAESIINGFRQYGLDIWDSQPKEEIVSSILSTSNAPTVLIEVDFMNTSLYKRLADPAHQEAIAGAIVAGIVQYMAN